MTPELMDDIRNCAAFTVSEYEGTGLDNEYAALRVLAWCDAQTDAMTPNAVSQARRLCYAILGYGDSEPGAQRIMAERLLDALKAQDEKAQAQQEAEGKL